MIMSYEFACCSVAGVDLAAAAAAAAAVAAALPPLTPQIRDAPAPTPHSAHADGR